MCRLAAVAVVGALLLFPSIASAVCEGQDLRETLAPETMRELHDRAAGVAFHEGIAFEALRGEKRLTLFGTVHVADPGVFVPEEIAVRIEGADLLLVELPSDVVADFERTLEANPTLLFDAEGPGLKGRLTADEWETLRDVFADLEIEPEMGDTIRPWLASLMLTASPCEMAAEAVGVRDLDERVEALARAAGVAVGGLDDDPENLLSFFSDSSEEEQLEQLRLSLATYALADDYVVTLVSAWNDEEIALMWELPRVFAVGLHADAASMDVWMDRFRETLVDARNRNWMTAILQRNREAQDVVVAVGALHLPGEYGLLRLLEREGYTIRRLRVF